MEVPVSEAKGLLTDLVKRAESGEEIVLTRHGRPVVRLVPLPARPTEAERRDLLRAVRTAGRMQGSPGPGAARSQDFLYDIDGLPQ
ncbi:Antitoxin [Rhodovastum atsumiense]|uniref:Antitoxin n=1 Tax=Rhodovastum atsumiense TaxID=504468 RepID=A0A5M6ILM2_9PROT|nr:type II toxin-antitoxin system prevent-host-death family antitoxin [Rhodovastum atsumiense]KAA5608759.1 type II toxin-antitoxin system prevent-host-death family antitoxin [Rhodovastum atsumiense]CAH2603029.1 Antitoxin [Rhodovastum atsumiense]